MNLQHLNTIKILQYLVMISEHFKLAIVIIMELVLIKMIIKPSNIIKNLLIWV
ncbi:hypothetical protein C2G38_2078365, partial [Gigaspora rosea]